MNENLTEDQAILTSKEKAVSQQTSDTAHLELHHIPHKLFVAPFHVHVLAYLIGKTDPEQRFLDVVKMLNLSKDEIVWQNQSAFLNGTLPGAKRVILRFETDENFCTLQTWIFPEDESDLNFGKFNIYPEGFSFPEDKKLTELDILITDKEFSPQSAEAMLPGAEILGSSVLNGLAKVVTNFQPDTEGRERYLVYADDAGSGNVDTVVDNIIKIENNYHLLYRPLKKYEIARKRMDKLEFNTAKQVNIINRQLKSASAEVLKSWIYDVTNSFAELATLNEQVSRYLDNASIYNENLQTALSSLKDEPLLKMVGLSVPLLNNANKISGEYSNLLQRIKNTGRQKAETITILRAKIDLLQRDQSFALQHSMHETTRSQMAMQQSIEGLYVFIVAFYLTELARIIFEALEYKKIIHTSPNVLSAYFIPVAILAALALSGKLKHWKTSYQIRKKTGKTPKQ